MMGSLRRNDKGRPSVPLATASASRNAKIGLSGPTWPLWWITAHCFEGRHGRGRESGADRPHDRRDVEARLCGRAVERRAHRPRHRAAAQDQRQRRDPQADAAAALHDAGRALDFAGRRRRGRLAVRHHRAAAGGQAQGEAQGLAEAAAPARPAGAGLCRTAQRRRRRACRPQPVRQRFEQGGDRASLRHLERFLPALPRRAHGLQLRLLHRFRQQHRPGAGRQARAYLPQAAAEARRRAARHRLRLGRDADPCRQALRRHRPRRLAVGSADRARPRAHSRRGPGGPHHHRGEILSRTRRHLRQDIVDRHVRAYRPRQSRRLFRGGAPAAEAGRHLPASRHHPPRKGAIGARRCARGRNTRRWSSTSSPAARSTRSA